VAVFLFGLSGVAGENEPSTNSSGMNLDVRRTVAKRCDSRMRSTIGSTQLTGDSIHLYGSTQLTGDSIHLYSVNKYHPTHSGLVLSFCSFQNSARPTTRIKRDAQDRARRAEDEIVRGIYIERSDSENFTVIMFCANTMALKVE